MTDILSIIAARAAERVAEAKTKKALAEIAAEAERMGCGDLSFPFEKALNSGDMAFICEIKKASPSKGIINEEFPYLSIAQEYEKAGASAISVLTEPYWFLGKDEYLTRIKNKVGIPVLRKDFTVDPYQIYEAKLLGADAVLLICSILDKEKLRSYVEIAHGLGLSALVEAHTEEEVENALKANARIVGVNNRNLKTFEVDLNTSIRLRRLVPESVLFVSESGIKTGEDIKNLRKNQVNGVLIGETLMRSGKIGEKLAELRRYTND